MESEHSDATVFCTFYLLSLREKKITALPRDTRIHTCGGTRKRKYIFPGSFSGEHYYTQPRTHTRGKEERGKEPTLFFSSEVSPFNAGEELKKAAARGGGGGGEGGGGR